jgi:hypothetical protein
MQRDPAGIAAHDLDHHHPPVRFGRGVQPPDGLGRDRYGGIEAEGEQGPVQVVVDGLGHAHHRQTQIAKPLGDAQGTVTADGDQGIAAHRPKAGQHFLGDIGQHHLLAPVHRIFERIALVDGPQDGTAQVGDAAHPIAIQGDQPIGFPAAQAFITIPDARHPPAPVQRPQGHGADYGVESRRITAAGIDEQMHAVLRDVRTYRSRPLNS